MTSGAEPDYKIKYSYPNDPYFPPSYGSWYQPYLDLWGLDKIQISSAWNKSKGENIIIAVVDTGVDYTHEDADIRPTEGPQGDGDPSNVWINEDERQGDDANCENDIDDDENDYVDDCYGWDFSGNGDPDPMDSQHVFAGHGTHVAGIIAADGDNATGIIGVAHEAKIMAIRAPDIISNGAAGIDYAANNGADIINCSWDTQYTETLNTAINDAYNKGALVVAASGNDFQEIPSSLLPSNHPKAITVGASTESDLRANFSNYGSMLDLIAPGGNDDGGDLEEPFENPEDSDRHNILSLKAFHSQYGNWLNVANNYVRVGGTSMAAPHVAGVTAMIMHLNEVNSRNLDLRNIRDIIRVTSNDIVEDGKGVDIYTGFGRLNANNAVNARCLTPYVDDNDIPGWAEDHVKTITCREVFTGDSDNKFRPFKTIRRDEAAYVIIRAKYTDNFDYETAPHFIDVPANHQFFKYIQKMKDDGITNGCAEDYYCPGSDVTRAQAATFTVRAVCSGLQRYDYPETPYFSDVPNPNDPPNNPNGHWAFPYVQELKQQLEISGCEVGKFCPEDLTNRAQMAVFMGKYNSRLNSKGGPRPLFKIWTKGREDLDCKTNP
jgi:hypothetical protein